MIQDKGLIKIINLEVKNKTMKSDILHFRKRLPVKYIMKYFDNDNIVQAYGRYLVLWELNIYRSKNFKQLSLEDLND